MDLTFSSALDLATAIRDRRVSATEVLEAHLARIAQRNPALNAVVTLDAEGARKRAREADEAIARDIVWGPLHGVPFTLKDAFATDGMRTTVGFPPFDHVPNHDAPVVTRLKSAGAILVGKTNVAQLLGDYQTNNPIFGRTNNPWNVERTSGGSSGGSAAAVASGMSPFEIGTDLSGSVRIPAHFCGIFGFKPTEHRVSLGGIAPAPGPNQPPRTIRVMSCVGPMARTVDDLGLLYSIIAGPDAGDTDVPPVPIEPVPSLEIAGLRIAIAPSLGKFPVTTDVRQAIDNLAHHLSHAGAIVEAAELPRSNLSEDLSRAGALLGMMVTASDPNAKNPASFPAYMAALQQRDEAIAVWDRWFDDWDALLCPPAMTSAFAHCPPGTSLAVDGATFDYWTVSAHTTLFNYTGSPAVVVPCGLDREGLPIGVQLVGRRWSDSRLLGVAKAISGASGGFQPPPDRSSGASS
jgi:amidase